MSKTIELARHLETLHINDMYKTDFYWTWDKTDDEIDAVFTVADALRDRSFPLVVDPVSVSQSGSRLLREDAVEALKERMIPGCDLLTPNRPEAEMLTGMTISCADDAAAAGEALIRMGAKAVLIKGGHMESSIVVTDCLCQAGQAPKFLPQPKVTSAVVTLRRRAERPWDVADQDIFFRVVRSSFAMRRKKLSNGLASGFPELGKQGAEDVLRVCGFPENVRGETLGIPEFALIANEIVRRREAK